VVEIAGGRTTEDEALEACVQERGTAPLNVAVKRGVGTDV